MTPTQVKTNRVSNNVENRSAGCTANQVRSQLFIKPPPEPDHRAILQTETACSMSISRSPSQSQTAQVHPYQISSRNNPVILENGSKAFVRNDSVDVVTASHLASNFKTPLPRHNASNLKGRTQAGIATHSSISVLNGAGGRYRYPRRQCHGINNNTVSKDENLVHTTYVRLSETSSSSTSASSNGLIDQPCRPAVKSILENRIPKKPIKKVAAKGRLSTRL